MSSTRWTDFREACPAHLKLYLLAFCLVIHNIDHCFNFWVLLNCNVCALNTEPCEFWIDVCKRSLLAVAQEVAEVGSSSPHLTTTSVPVDAFQIVQSYNEKSLKPWERSVVPLTVAAAYHCSQEVDFLLWFWSLVLIQFAVLLRRTENKTNL